MGKILTQNGIISSSVPIDIKIGAATSIYVSGSGRVGIGNVTEPSGALDVSGALYLSRFDVPPTTPGADRIVVYASSSTDHLYIKIPDGSVFDLSLSGSSGSGADVLAKVSSNDTTAGYLNGKLVAGTNITFNERNDGANETLEISASLGGRYDYGTASIDPVSPSPTEGDKYYNTVLEMEMRYDGSRSKWLSIETSIFGFGKTANNAGGSYYRSLDGISFSATNGFPTFHSGTVLSLGYSRDDTDATVFQVTANGSEVAFLSSSAVSGESSALNGDFSPNVVLGVLNKSGGNTVTNGQGWVRVKWRI